MKISSPLRYPGGKSAMADLLGQIRTLNNLGGYTIAEPYAGGAGASLTLLYLEYTKKIFINDADMAIHDFWWSLVNQHKRFLDLLSSTEVNMKEWFIQRDNYRKRNRISRVRRGFATFFLNRCNRSGIIVNGGPIGGIEQNGKWKLDARINKASLQSRCKKIAEYRERIIVSCDDGIEFLDKMHTEKTMFFIDPPYFGKGPTLYLDTLNTEYHQALANRLRSIADKAWVLTYDDCPQIRSMYSGWAHIRPYSLMYTANNRCIGNEVLVVPKWMKLPNSQGSSVVRW
ncbi:MAG: DNA adenine methylase [Gemmatimonadetes bacterium]|nr:DNA adenine methylase [Gemmatimonadota bacterium]